MFEIGKRIENSQSKIISHRGHRARRDYSLSRIVEIDNYAQGFEIPEDGLLESASHRFQQRYIFSVFSDSRGRGRPGVRYSFFRRKMLSPFLSLFTLLTHTSDKLTQTALTAALFLTFMIQAQALEFIDRKSPHNSERPDRQATYFLILHTTEGPSQGSLNKIWRNGEAHYLVDTDGKVYRVIDRDKVAFHCGRSMWNGRTGIDDYAIGIEVCGYYDRNITAAQYKSLRELLNALKKIYRIPDERVLTHSMVAYGAPNRWFSRSHRGRKRCGMLFARNQVRERLGLYAKPAFDPDVKAKRLMNADPELAAVLYGGAAVIASQPEITAPVKEPEKKATPPKETTPANVVTKDRSAWDIARDNYRSPETIYIFPDGNKMRGNEITNWRYMPVGTKILVEDSSSNEDADESAQEIEHVDGAKEVAGDEYRNATTIYLFPNGTSKNGSNMTDEDFKKLPAKTKMLVGYTEGGKVTSKKKAFDICGRKWNFPSTVYFLPDGTMKFGNEIEENNIPTRTQIFYRQ